MSDEIQIDGTPGPLPPPPLPPAAAETAGLPGGPRLRVWLVVLVVTGAGTLILGLTEAAFLVALAGLFVAAQAADLYRGQRDLYWALTWVVPATGLAVFLGFAWLVWNGDPGVMRIPLALLSVVSAVICALTVFRPFSDRLTRAFFRHEEPTHALRLATRLIVMGLLMALPGWYALQGSIEEVLGDETILDQDVLGSGLLGYVVLALAAVGFLVRRNLPDTLERLGVRPFQRGDLLLIPLGVAALFLLNVALEYVQRTWFPELWAADQRVTELIASGLGVGQILMLGVSAGIGEEITLRGALQPKLGIAVTSLLFAALHIQYSWFGMGVIFAFGLLLGYLRNRASTSTVMAIHTLYDVVAVASLSTTS